MINLSKLKHIFLIATAFVALFACSDSSLNNTSINIEKSGLRASTVVALDSSATQVESFQPLASFAVSQFGQVARTAEVMFKKLIAIDLGAPSQQMLRSQANTTSALGKPLKTGFARDVAQTASSGKTASVWEWQTTSAGKQVAAIQFASTSAAGLRVGLVIDSLPAAALLRFYSPGADKMFEVTGAHVMETLTRNQKDGDASDSAKTYWGPVVDGASVVVELELATETAPASIKLAIPKVMHLFRDTTGQILGLPNLRNVGDAASCHVDALCQDANNRESRKSVAKVSFISGGYAYTCSGTLLNDTINSGIPYFITANHCVSNQTEASTVNTFWKLESTACNSGVVNPGYTLLSGGATYLYGSSFTAGSDTAFMQLAGTPPVGVVFKGWSAVKPDLNIAVNSLHHPQGDMLKYLAGTIDKYANVVDAGGGYFDIVNTTNGYTSNYVNLSATSGVAEDGSSGSPMITAGALGSGKFIGQMLGGSSSCAAPTGSNIYGRFDVAYNDALSTWLSPGKKPVFRFYNGMSGTHFYSNSPAESNYLKVNFPYFGYEGVAFNSGTLATGGLSPVYRFYNLNLGNHFYTISAAERDFVKANLPQMRDEGIAWYAQPANTAGMIPLYRFYNRDKGVHFYSVSVAERDWVIANLPQMNNEGIAYYVWP